jgi:hypothetical protein
MQLNLATCTEQELIDYADDIAGRIIHSADATAEMMNDYPQYPNAADELVKFLQKKIELVKQHQSAQATLVQRFGYQSS